MKFLEWLFDYHSFVPRYKCGAWDDWLISLNQTSNMGIFLAYTAIAAMLGYLWYIKRRDIPSHWIVLCFMSFIFWCGVTHLCNYTAFYITPYRLFTLIDFITMLFSITTAILLPYVIQTVAGLQSYISMVKDIQREMTIRQELERVLYNYKQRRLRRQTVLEDIIKSYETRPEDAPEKLKALLVEYQNENSSTFPGGL